MDLTGIKLEAKSPDYDKYDVCPKCGGANKLSKQVTDSGLIHECDTTCTKCDHTDYWAYGWYESNHFD